jgi:hypothetical protein
MAGGKAHAKDRRYQETCRDILIHREPKLTPWSGDGIDVVFDLADTAWTVDIALRDDAGRLVVAECKRWTAAVKQGDVAQFAYEIERLREKQGIEVAGVFIAKTNHQIGAVRVGQFNSIDIAVLGEDAEPPSFGMTFLRYDPERKMALSNTIIHIGPAALKLSDLALKAALDPGRATLN